MFLLDLYSCSRLICDSFFDGLKRLFGLTVSMLTGSRHAVVGNTQALIMCEALVRNEGQQRRVWTAGGRL